MLRSSQLNASHNRIAIVCLRMQYKTFVVKGGLKTDAK